MKYNFFIILIFIVNIYLVSTRIVSQKEEEILEKHRRNSICCKKNMRCCNLPPPNIEIRAILTRCPNLGKDGGVVTRKVQKPIIADSEYNIKKFQGFDQDEPLIQTELTNCRRKVLLTLKIRNSGAQNCKIQYIVVDHVYDPVTEKNVRILNPYVIKLKQEPVYKVYPLQFIDYVNSEAREQVYNKHDRNYTGCYTKKSRSTCGLVKYQGKIIPYSEGFCCSCDLKVNIARQPDSLSAQNEEVISYSDPAYLLDAVQCPRNYVPHKTNNTKRYMHEFDINYPRNNLHISTSTPDTSKRWTYLTHNSKNSPEYSTVDTLDTHHTYLLSSKNKRDISSDMCREESARNHYLKMLQTLEEKKNRCKYMKAIKKAHSQSEDELSDDTVENVNKTRKKRQTYPSGVQKRGGQNCADRYTPPHLDPIAYHESTHCLRFSDVWYGIYKLVQPDVEQNIYIKVFERYEGESSAVRWREITNSNKTVRIGQRYPHYHDDKDELTISLTSKALRDSDEEMTSKLMTKRILIPENICNMNKYPELRNGPEEYLVVNPNLITIEGNQCDRIGVSFEAFYRQRKRCARPRGSCLHNQPKHLWKHDHKLARRNKTGCYFLKYFANITRTPIMENATTGDKFLQLEYRGHYMSILDFEINADFNTVIRPQPLAVITEIYIDSTCTKETILMIKVTNAGLVSSKFRVQLTDIPLELTDEICKVKSALILIPPQNQHIFTLVIRTDLPTDLFHATVEVLNEHNELVALRRVRIQKFDRCICTWHCLCACIASNTGIKCRPMSLEHYHAAGFQGDLPVDTHIVHYTMLDDMLSLLFYFTLFLLLVMLALGLTKALLGLCIVAVGLWGLSIILDLPKPMNQYYERRLKGTKVLYDKDGWPIDPNTGAQAMNVSCITMFCTNLVFFFIYPFACCMLICRRLCCSYYTKRPREGKGQPPQKPSSKPTSAKSKSPPRTQTTRSSKSSPGSSPKSSTPKSSPKPKGGGKRPKSM